MYCIFQETGTWSVRCCGLSVITHRSDYEFQLNWPTSPKSLQWRHNERNGVSNHRRLDCLLNRLFRSRSKKASKLRITGLCTGKMASNHGNAEYVSIWWRHHGKFIGSSKCQWRIPELGLKIEYMNSLSLRWRHNGHDIVSNHQSHHCLLNRLFGCRSKKTSKLRVTGLCAGNSPETGEFPAEMASNAENLFPFDDVIMLSV